MSNALCETSSDEEDMVIHMGMELLSDAVYIREPCRDSVFPGAVMMHEVLNGHANRCYEEFRMERHVFLNLCDYVRHRGWLKDTTNIRVDEQLGMFLWIVGKGSSNRDTQNHCNHSGETISRTFNVVLIAMQRLAKEKIRPPDVNMIPIEIAQNPKYYHFFKHCIGAIDGTHIHAVVPREDQIRYRNRKGITTQNVMCACSFDMRFTYVYAGWEGSANDCRVLEQARNDPRLSFPHPPPGKYYVVDSGYASQSGFLTPFRGERYHLPDYKRRRRSPRTAKELFNYRHSSLRNVIERTFGVLKNKFKILRLMISSQWKLRHQSYWHVVGYTTIFEKSILLMQNSWG